MSQSFNITARLQLEAGNFQPVISSIQREIGGISTNINAGINPASARGVAQMAANVQGLQTVLKQTQTSATQLNQVLGKNTGSGAATSGLKSLSSQVYAAQKSLADFQNIVSGGTSQMFKFGQQAALSGRRFLAFSIGAIAFVKVASSLRDAAGEALDFQRNMVRLGQLGAVSNKEISEISDTITNLSKTLGVSSKELADASIYLKGAGLSVSEVKDALAALAKTSLAPTFKDLKSTTEGLLSLRAQFNLSGKDYEGVLGSINNVAREFAAESEDIIEAVRRSGAAFKAAAGDLQSPKQSLNEFVALFTSVRSTTRESAESIATSLRTVFARLQSNDVVNNLKQMGINLRYTREEAGVLGQNIEGQFVGGYKAIQRLSAALKGVPTTDPRFSAVVQQIGGTRQVSKVVPLLTQSETAQKAYAAAVAGTTSLTRDADKAQEAFTVRIEKLKEEFTGLIREISQSKFAGAFIDGLITMASAATKVISAFKPLIPLLAALAAFKIGTSIVPALRGFTSPPLVNPARHAMGGVVGGGGHTDSVPLSLPIGTYVIPKPQAAKLPSKVKERLIRGNANKAGGKLKDVVVMPGEIIVPPENAKAMYPLLETIRTGQFSRNQFARGGFVSSGIRLGASIGLAKVTQMRRTNPFSKIGKQHYASGGKISDQIDNWRVREHFESLMAGPHGPKVASHLPEGSEYLGSGTTAVAIKRPDGKVVRIGGLGMGIFSRNQNRPVDKMVLQPFSTHRYGDKNEYQVEELPLATPLDKMYTGQAHDSRKDKIVRAYNKRLLSQGKIPTDTSPQNIGRFNKRIVAIDPEVYLPSSPEQVEEYKKRHHFAKGGLVDSVLMHGLRLKDTAKKSPIMEILGTLLEEYSGTAAAHLYRSEVKHSLNPLAVAGAAGAEMVGKRLLTRFTTKKGMATGGLVDAQHVHMNPADLYKMNSAPKIKARALAMGISTAELLRPGGGYKAGAPVRTGWDWVDDKKEKFAEGGVVGGPSLADLRYKVKTGSIKIGTPEYAEYQRAEYLAKVQRERGEFKKEDAAKPVAGKPVAQFGVSAPEPKPEVSAVQRSSTYAEAVHPESGQKFQYPSHLTGNDILQYQTLVSGAGDFSRGYVERAMRSIPSLSHLATETPEDEKPMSPATAFKVISGDTDAFRKMGRRAKTQGSQTSDALDAAGGLDNLAIARTPVNTFFDEPPTPDVTAHESEVQNKIRELTESGTNKHKIVGELHKKGLISHEEAAKGATAFASDLHPDVDKIKANRDLASIPGVQDFFAKFHPKVKFSDKKGAKAPRQLQRLATDVRTAADTGRYEFKAETAGEKSPAYVEARRNAAAAIIKARLSQHGTSLEAGSFDPSRGTDIAAVSSMPPKPKPGVVEPTPIVEQVAEATPAKIASLKSKKAAPPETISAAALAPPNPQVEKSEKISAAALAPQVSEAPKPLKTSQELRESKRGVKLNDLKTLNEISAAAGTKERRLRDIAERVKAKKDEGTFIGNDPESLGLVDESAKLRQEADVQLPAFHKAIKSSLPVSPYANTRDVPIPEDEGDFDKDSAQLKFNSKEEKAKRVAAAKAEKAKQSTVKPVISTDPPKDFVPPDYGNRPQTATSVAFSQPKSPVVDKQLEHILTKVDNNQPLTEAESEVHQRYVATQPKEKPTTIATPTVKRGPGRPKGSGKKAVAPIVTTSDGSVIVPSVKQATAKQPKTREVDSSKPLLSALKAILDAVKSGFRANQNLAKKTVSDSKERTKKTKKVADAVQLSPTVRHEIPKVDQGYEIADSNILRRDQSRSTLHDITTSMENPAGRIVSPETFPLVGDVHDARSPETFDHARHGPDLSPIPLDGVRGAHRTIDRGPLPTGRGYDATHPLVGDRQRRMRGQPATVQRPSVFDFVNSLDFHNPISVDENPLTQEQLNAEQMRGFSRRARPIGLGYEPHRLTRSERKGGFKAQTLNDFQGESLDDVDARKRRADYLRQIRNVSGGDRKKAYRAATNKADLLIDKNNQITGISDDATKFTPRNINFKSNAAGYGKNLLENSPILKYITGRTSVGADGEIPQRFGKFGAGLKTAGRVGLGGVAVASQLLPDYISSATGGYETPGSDEKTVTYGKQVGGALAGAGGGAVLGSAAGPLGTAIGAIIGGLHGFISATKEAAQELHDIKIDQTFKRLDSVIEGVVSGRAKLTPDVIASTAKGLDEGDVAEAKKNAFKHQGDLDITQPIVRSLQRAVGLAVESDPENVTKSQTAGRAQYVRENVAPRVGLYRGLNETLARDTKIDDPNLLSGVNGSGEPLSERELSRNRDLRIDEFKRKGGESIANKVVEATPGLTHDAYYKEIDKIIVETNRERLAHQSLTKAITAQEIQTAKFLRIGAAVDVAVTSMKNLQSGLDSLDAAFNNQLAATPIKSHADAAANFGGLDNESFNKSVDFVTGGLSSHGQSDLVDNFGQTAKAVSHTASVLPDVINEASAGGGIAGEGLSSRITQGLSFRGLPQVVINKISDVLGSMKPEELAKAASENVTKLADSLIKDGFANVNEVLQNAAKALEERANNYSQSLIKNQENINKIGESQDKYASLQVRAAQSQARVSAEVVGRPSQADLTVETQLAPIQQRQERLTGLKGRAANTPELIGAKLNATRADIASVREQRDNSTDPGVQNAASEELARLQGNAQRLGQALEHLADPVEKNAILQEKLNRIEASRDSKLSFTEKLATASPQQRADMQRNAAFSDVAVQRGSLAGLHPEIAQGALEHLSSLGEAELPGYGGRKASDVRKSLLVNTGLQTGILNQRDEKQRIGLMGEQAGNDQTAVSAQGEIIKSQQSLQAEFFSELKNMQSEFFTKLATSMAEATKKDLQSQSGSNLEKLNKAQTGIIGANFLSGLGGKGGLTPEEAKRAKDANIGGLSETLNQQSALKGKFAQTSQELLRPGKLSDVAQKAFGGTARTPEQQEAKYKAEGDFSSHIQSRLGVSPQDAPKVIEDINKGIKSVAGPGGVVKPEDRNRIIQESLQSAHGRLSQSLNSQAETQSNDIVKAVTGSPDVNPAKKQAVLAAARNTRGFDESVKATEESKGLNLGDLQRNQFSIQQNAVSNDNDLARIKTDALTKRKASVPTPAVGPTSIPRTQSDAPLYPDAPLPNFVRPATPVSFKQLTATTADVPQADRRGRQLPIGAVPAAYTANLMQRQELPGVSYDTFSGARKPKRKGLVQKISAPIPLASGASQAEKERHAQQVTAYTQAVSSGNFTAKKPALPAPLAEDASESDKTQHAQQRAAYFQATGRPKVARDELKKAGLASTQGQGVQVPLDQNKKPGEQSQQKGNDPMAAFNQNIQTLNGVIGGFDKTITNMGTTLSNLASVFKDLKIPEKITVERSGEVKVVINGGQLLAALTGDVGKLVQNDVLSSIKEQLPGIIKELPA